jgi:predicted nucleotidyltransferase
MRPAPSSATQHPLDGLLGTTALVRVIRVLAVHGGGLAVGDIGRRARLSLPSTREAIARLAEAGLVRTVGVGRSSLCTFVDEHPLGGPLRKLFGAERAEFGRLLTGMRRATEQLSPAPVALWLYGSAARGKDRPTSDLDLAAVFQTTPDPGTGDRLREALAAAVPAYASRLSLITLSIGDVVRLAREDAQFWHELARDAVVLHGVAPVDLVEQTGGAPAGVGSAGAA